MFCEVSRVIPAAPTTVWQVLGDLARLKDWLPVQVEIALPQGTRAAVGAVIQVKRQTRVGLIEIDQCIDHCEEAALLAWKHTREVLNGSAVTQVKDFSTTISLVASGENQTRVTVRSIWSSVGPMGILTSTMLKPRLLQEYATALENIEKLVSVKV
jgi:carbon monoxide dehydrogenase subunit G